MSKSLESQLSADQINELAALRDTNDATGHKSFIARFHWHESGYQKLVRAGLVNWTDPDQPFDPRRYAGTEITAKGRALLTRLEASEPEQ